MRDRLLDAPQPDLFDGPAAPRDPYGGVPPFVMDSDTSREAAMSLVEEAPTVRMKVLGFIRVRGTVGVTDCEIEQALGLRHQTASARRRELELQGLVVKTDQRRPTDTGRMAGVYVAAETT